MSRRVSRWVSVLATAAIIAGCSAAGGPSASPVPSPLSGGSSASPVSSASSDAPAAPAYRLRAATTQAIPPVNRFGFFPMVTITGDNEVVVAGPQIMIYPGPLLPNLQARPITDAGFEQIVQRGTLACSRGAAISRRPMSPWAPRSDASRSSSTACSTP